jgi:dTMP kinase
MFIVLEGSDGSGKTTQFRLLTERLKAAGHDVDVYDFPRYEEPSSYFVKRYLNGDYGPASNVSPYTASFFFALDRFEAAPLIRQSLARGKMVLANRYTGSNMAHQGAKFSKLAEQRGYFLWADSLEFQLMGIPRPTLNIFLRVPAETSYELIKQKAKRSYTDKSHDEHESDIKHLKQSVAAYDTLCELFTKDFKAINCVRQGKMLPVTAVNNLIWDTLKPILPKPSHPGRSAVVNLQNNTDLKAKTPSRGLRRSAREKKESSDNTQLKDVSLLLLSRLQGYGLSLNYELSWPSDAKSRLDYYIPVGLSPKMAKKYKSALDKIAAINRRLRDKLSPSDKPLADMTTPLAALVDVRVSGSQQTLEQLLPEIGAMGLEESRQIAKNSQPRDNNPQTLDEIIKHINDSRISAHGATPDNPVGLAAVFPRNEFDLLADSLYAFSNHSRDEIAAQIDSMSYQQKAEALKALCAADSAGLLEKLLYQFDIIGDIRSIDQLIGALGPVKAKIQPPTPRYGYEVPEAIEDTGLADDFIDCFDVSLELYSELQAAGHETIAGYTVLRGHRQRWQFNLNGGAVFAEGQVASPVAAKLIKALRERAAEVHPLIAAAISAPKKPDVAGNSSNGSSKAAVPRRRRRNKSR